MGAEFPDNSIAIDAVREGVRLAGHVSIPSYNRANALQQYAYVNGRPVRDKLIAGAIRGAFADVLPRDRHAVAVLFLTLDPALVDVNVHPAKADVRFRDPGLVRGLIVGAIREALAERRHPRRHDGCDGDDGRLPARRGQLRPSRPGQRPSRLRPAFRASAAAGFDAARSPQRPLEMGFGERRRRPSTPAARQRRCARRPAPPPRRSRHGAGAARAQVHENYIVAQTRDSLVIVDQHAAHERLVYEALKKALHSRPVPAQMLLFPEIVDLPEDDAERLPCMPRRSRRFGLGIERFGPGAVAVRETPAMLGETNVAASWSATSPTRSPTTTRPTR